MGLGCDIPVQGFWNNFPVIWVCGEEEEELDYKSPPTPCFWKAPASAQKTTRKTRLGSARWRAIWVCGVFARSRHKQFHITLHWNFMPRQQPLAKGRWKLN